MLGVLSGCVALQSASQSSSSVLLSVRLMERENARRAANGLIVSVGDERGVGGRQFAFVPNERVAGSYTNFLVRLDLPAGHYRLRQLTGVANGGAVVPPFDVDAAVAFEVRPDSTDYLGRIEVNAPATGVRRGLDRGMPHGTFLDRYREDLPDLLEAWPVLRTRAIERRPLPDDAAR